MTMSKSTELQKETATWLETLLNPFNALAVSEETYEVSSKILLS